MFLKLRENKCLLTALSCFASAGFSFSGDYTVFTRGNVQNFIKTLLNLGLTLGINLAQVVCTICLDSFCTTAFFCEREAVGSLCKDSVFWWDNPCNMVIVRSDQVKGKKGLSNN